MYDVLSPVRGLLKIDDITIDNAVFKLHYKITVILLLTISLLLTQRQYFGDPIDCMLSPGADKLYGDVIDTYCWIFSTYLNAPETGKNVVEIYKGVGTSSGRDQKIVYHTYYQWVTLFIYLQAMTFYLPRYLWKIWEGSKIKMLVSDLHFPIVDEETKTERIALLISYLNRNVNDLRAYMAKYAICEVLNFSNVLFQIYLTDWFVGNTFATYGRDVLSLLDRGLEEKNDAMETAFPKITKCDFAPYGYSGSAKIINALCVLPLNIFNEKIFVVLWLWFITLAVLSGCSLVYRCATFISRRFRHITLAFRTTLCKSRDIEIISMNIGLGEWFFLYQITKNMDPLIFKEFAAELSKQKLVAAEGLIAVTEVEQADECEKTGFPFVQNSVRKRTVFEGTT